MFRAGFVFSLCVLHVANAVQLTSVITPEDGKRLLSFFKAPYKDVETAADALAGLKQYTQGGAIGTQEKEAACKAAQSCDKKSISSLYYAAMIKNILGSSCKIEFTKQSLDLASSKLSQNSDTTTIYRAVSILTTVGKKVDNAAVTALISNALKEDNTILSSTYALLAGARLEKQSLATILKSADVEDMAAQADEVDGRYLHFDHNLEATSVFLSAVFLVSDNLKQAPLISSEQIILFANFLLRSKTAVSNCKEAFLIAHGLGSVASSSQISVAKADITSGSSISQESPHVSVVVSNVFGQPMTRLNVKADSVTRSSDDEVVVSNLALKFDGIKTYSMPLWSSNLKSGFYDVSLTVASPGAKLVGASDLQFKVKVTTKISLVNIELGATERESTSGALKKIEFLKKADQLKADNQQKIVMKFQVQSASDKSLLSPHQAFVRFLHEKSGQEVIFVAEPDKDLTFKFEVDLATGGRDQFNSVSGKYSVHLIVGDVAISNPVFWNFADVILQLGDEVQKAKSSFEEQYARKPEIHHIFREPEKRPPVVVSQAFTLACLAPLFFLFILWAKLGANLGGFQLSLKSIVFHVGLAGIFVLYYMFWTKWNMFTTLQYLGVVGTLTFVFGNSVLSDIANNR